MPKTFKDSPITVSGETKQVGETAPDFQAINRDLSVVSLSDFEDDVIVISVVPSIDTSVCDFQTKQFNQRLNDLKGVRVITISNDLPFAQKRWCASEGLESITTLSDHRDLDFAKKYGTLIEELRLQARSVFVLDKDRKITYVEYLDEMSGHPDYEQAIKHVESLL